MLHTLHVLHTLPVLHTLRMLHALRMQAYQPSRIYRETHDFTTKLKVSQTVALNSRIFS